MTRCPPTLAPVAALLLAASAPGCAGPPRVSTTALGSADLVDMTDRMARSLAADAAVASRSSAEQPWVVSIDRVSNHTNEIIPEREKWLYVARLRALLARSDFSRRSGVIWTIPPERWPLDARTLDLPPNAYGPRREPTHLLTARFHALTRTSGRGRADAYFCDFQLVALEAGEIVWEDAWEVRRSILGRTYD